jgi:hypothetical protein
MKPTGILLLLILLIAAARAAEAPVALLNPGEAFTYRVGWGVLGHAGELTVRADAETIEGLPHIRITTGSHTRGFVRVLFRFDGEAQTLFDVRDGRLLSARATTESGKERTQASIVFDYKEAKAFYVDHLRPQRTTTLDLPEGHPMDLITNLIQTRVWALKPGDTRDVLVLFDDEFYPLRITAEKEETIATPSGPRNAILLIPRMLGQPKGMFRRGGEVRVWVSAGQAGLPLRFEVKLKVGTAYAVLDEQPATSLP